MVTLEIQEDKMEAWVVSSVLSWTSPITEVRESPPFELDAKVPLTRNGQPVSCVRNFHRRLEACRDHFIMFADVSIDIAMDELLFRP